MSVNKKMTSKSIASLAAKTLRDKNASKTAKELAGSALSQKVKSHQTGAEMEDGYFGSTCATHFGRSVPPISVQTVPFFLNY